MCETSHSRICPFGPSEQSPTADNARHSSTAALSAVLDFGEKILVGVDVVVDEVVNVVVEVDVEVKVVVMSDVAVEVLMAVDVVVAVEVLVAVDVVAAGVLVVSIMGTHIDPGVFANIPVLLAIDPSQALPQSS